MAVVKGRLHYIGPAVDTNSVEVRLGAPGGQLIARSGPGSFSQLTNKSIREGTKIFLQDVSNNQPLTSAYTLDSVTLHLTAAPRGSITANPNPFVQDSQGVGQTTVAWTSYGTTAVEIHVNAPNGPRFAGGDSGSFSMATGRWVVDGMTFYLQNVSNGLPLTAANTLATVTMSAVSLTPSGSISANPNPFVPNAQGLGQTTLTWTSAGTNNVELHVNAPNGNRLAATRSRQFFDNHWAMGAGWNDFLPAKCCQRLASHLGEHTGNSDGDSQVMKVATAEF